MSWNSVYEFHQMIRGDVHPETLRYKNEESKVTTVKEREKEKEPASRRKSRKEKEKKSIGSEAQQGGEMSKSTLKKTEKSTPAGDKTQGLFPRVDARVGEAGGILEGRGMGFYGGISQGTGKERDLEFGGEGWNTF
ncbi:hypothetical protein VTL71DRAFT_5937 [Oculimacula yallundae]|uniref:Uncharacterized protein n=1 Tax=Oculimacula yallundae TaxID=86028 RepID=A0ABR4BYW9_9HELO